MRQLSRRTFLRGAGTVVALPVLEAMLPASARAQAMMPRRLLVYFVPNGIHMPAWTPAEAGPGYALTPILASLEPVKEEVLVLTGRPQDAWLATWSRAEAAVPHPLDPMQLADTVVRLLRERVPATGS